MNEMYEKDTFKLIGILDAPKSYPNHVIACIEGTFRDSSSGEVKFYFTPYRIMRKYMGNFTVGDRVTTMKDNRGKVYRLARV